MLGEKGGRGRSEASRAEKAGSGAAPCPWWGRLGRRGAGEGVGKRWPRRDPATMVVLRCSDARRGPPFAIMDSSSEFVSLQPTALSIRRTWRRSHGASTATRAERRGRLAVSSAWRRVICFIQVKALIAESLR